jgi:hypothetical protein
MRRKVIATYRTVFGEFPSSTLRRSLIKTT